MIPAAKHFDIVSGVCTHMIQPTGPVPPVPVPHPFIGMLMDPGDVPMSNATVMINNMPRAIAGTVGVGMPPHIPIGGAFVPPPMDECELMMGSSTVTMDGDGAGSSGLQVYSCQTPAGSPAPPRTNSKKKTKLKALVLPTSVLSVIPAGLPVTVGGPPAPTTPVPG